ncbi:hypothetical protein B0H14DRAFT_3870069, partial [Mycena olivaceomarginata]
MLEEQKLLPPSNRLGPVSTDFQDMLTRCCDRKGSVQRPGKSTPWREWPQKKSRKSHNAEGSSGNMRRRDRPGIGQQWLGICNPKQPPQSIDKSKRF